MSTLELKKKLVSRILNTESAELLWEVSRLLDIENDEQRVEKLSDQQKNSIIQGQKEIMNGNFLTNEEANSEIDEWLKE